MSPAVLRYTREEILACRPRLKGELSAEPDPNLVACDIVRSCLIISSSKKVFSPTITTEPKLFLLNAQSLKSKSEVVTELLGSRRPDLLCVTESWLTPLNGDHLIASICPPGYSGLHESRSIKKGGGGVVIFRSSLAIQRVFDIPACDSFEFLNLSIMYRLRRVRLLVVYRPPASSTTVFMTEFQAVLEILSTLPEKVIIVGDFNIHVDVPSDKLAVTFLELIETFGFSQLVKTSTHSRKKKAIDQGHTLDLVLARQLDDEFVRSVQVGDFVSDHRLVSFAMQALSPGWPVCEVQTRPLKSIDPDAFLADIRELPLLVSPSDSLDGLVQQYNDGLRSVLDKHAPLRLKKVVLRPTVPWWSIEINREKRKVRRAERVWRKRKLAVFFEIYINRLAEFSTLLQRIKTEFFRGKVAELKGNRQALHQLIEGSLDCKRRAPVLPSQLDSKSLSAEFSNFFSSKVNKIRSDLDLAVGSLFLPGSPSTHTSRRPNRHSSPGVVSTPAGRRRRVLAWRTTASASSTVSTPSAQRLFSSRSDFNVLCDFKHLSPDDVTRLAKFSPSSSCQLGPIPTFLLKKYLQPLAPSIAKIINHSLSSGSFPAALKHALVKPLLKKADMDKEVLANYRPVSNTPFLSKLIERAVAWQLLDQVNDILPERQSAYRPNFSTETSLLCLFDDLLRAADDSDGTALLFLDLSAAFDTIDHRVLLDRLSGSGIRGAALGWFGSYLSDRSQSVIVDGVTSDPMVLECGVPQGSVLGPLLFLVYVAALPDETHINGVVVDQFSDDTQARARFSFRISSNHADCSSTPSPFSVRRGHGSTRGRRNTGRGRRRRRSSTYFPSQADATAALSSWAVVADKWFTTNRVKCNIGKTIMMFA
jgi:hypothetical protein